jgi:hypothetical protein
MQEIGRLGELLQRGGLYSQLYQQQLELAVNGVREPAGDTVLTA